MNRTARALIGGALLLASLAAMGVLTRARYTATPERAELRLAWRTRVPRIEECRTPTAEELAEIPSHMRQAEICEGRSGSYRLEVAVDGQVRHRSVVRAAGARADRPLYVFEELPVKPGRRTVRVVFERADSLGPSDHEPAVPTRLVFQRTLLLEPLDVALVTYDTDSRRLVLRAGTEE